MILTPEKNIKKIRELKNISQDYIASNLNLTTRAYSKIETSETQLTVNRLNEISVILGVDPLEIIGFNERQIFNNCKQEGNIGINNITVPEKLIEQYEKLIIEKDLRIKTLEELVSLLKVK
jgi:transcriptional regulator with XRE-family HTH domain